MLFQIHQYIKISIFYIPRKKNTKLQELYQISTKLNDFIEFFDYFKIEPGFFIKTAIIYFDPLAKLQSAQDSCPLATVVFPPLE